MADTPAPFHPPSTGALDADRLDVVRACLDDIAGKTALDALPHLRKAADLLTELLDETMAAAVLSGQASLRSAGQHAGLTENAVGPRLARTKTLGAYADPRGRVTASGVERAKYDHETGIPRPPSQNTSPLRFKPRRSAT